MVISEAFDEKIFVVRSAVERDRGFLGFWVDVEVPGFGGLM